MEIKGIVYKIGETIQVSDKFKKREIVITTEHESKYPQHISLQAAQDKVVMFDNLGVGQEVTASINIRGREWTSPTGEVKFFNTIECWKLDVKNEVINNNITPQVQLDDLPF